MIKTIEIKIGLATASNLCHPVSLSNSDREITLPNSQLLLEKLNKWQEVYNQMTRPKLSRKVKPNDDIPPNTSEADIAKLVARCKEFGDEVLRDFNTWLESNSFIEGIHAQQVDSSDQVQILLQIKDKNLERLPWHLADIFQKFNTEVALFKPSESSDKNRKDSRNNKIKTLAVFGSDKNTKSKKDLEKLEKISSWDLVSLTNKPEEELSKKKIFNTLDKDRWDIFFFAGHSSSDGKERIGKIYLHDNCDGLTFEDIKSVINRSVKKGLKIAFFNSCDGLGLGHSLSKLGVPQTIVMKEPVTDIIAQKFLEDFLDQYSQGASFYQSVRHARENLEREDFPCADWLPTICQSSRDYPPSWEDLPGKRKKEPVIDIHWGFKVIALAIVILSLVPRTQVFAVGIEQSIQSLVRMTILKDKSPVEQSLDLPVSKIRYPEKPNLVLIHIDKESLKDLEDEKSKTQTGKFEPNPIDKEYLANIIKKLTRAGVRAIAIDYILDKPSQDKSDKSLNMAIREAVDKYQVKFLFASESKDGSQVSIASNQTIQSRQSIATGDIGFVSPISIFPSIQPNLIQYIQSWSQGEDKLVLFSYFLAMMQEEHQNQDMDNWIKNTIQNSQIIPVIDPIPLLTSLTIDYSRSPDSIYNRISAKQFLKTLKSPELDNPTDKVVLIAPGGYVEATTDPSQLGDNYEVPLAILLRSLVEQKKYIDKDRPFTGGEIQAYIAGQLLTKNNFITKSVLIRVSDLLMVLIAMVASHYVVKYYTRKNILVILVYGSVIYIIFCLTIYSIANIMIPFVLPCATTTLAYIFPIRRIKNRV